MNNHVLLLCSCCPQLKLAGIGETSKELIFGTLEKDVFAGRSSRRGVWDLSPLLRYHKTLLFFEKDYPLSIEVLDLMLLVLDGEEPWPCIVQTKVHLMHFSGILYPIPCDKAIAPSKTAFPTKNNWQSPLLGFTTLTSLPQCLILLQHGLLYLACARRHLAISQGQTAESRSLTKLVCSCQKVLFQVLWQADGPFAAAPWYLKSSQARIRVGWSGKGLWDMPKNFEY